MKILFLAHRVPYPPNRGDRIRSFHLLKHLAATAEVHLAFACEEPINRTTREALSAVCAEVVAEPLGHRMRWVRAAWSVATGGTATVGLFRSGALRRRIEAMAERTQFDRIVVFCSSMVPYLSARHLRGIPAIVDLVDVDSQKWFDYAEQSSRGWKRRLFRLEGNRLRRLESSLAERSAAITVVTEEEATLLRSFCPGGRIKAIHNGVDMEYFRPEPRHGTVDETTAAAPEGEDCVFVGALDYRANIDGVRWFVETVWPETRRRRSTARFLIVGSRPGEAVRRLAEAEGVELVGEVPDVRPWLRRASLVVVPLRVARGVQNKVLEAAAMGKAVLASPEALEGIRLEPGEHVVRAGDASAWIESIESLLSEPARRTALGRAARLEIERSYSWESNLKALDELLRSS